MIGNKYTGDSIATEFMKIMGTKTSPGESLEKSASVENDLVEAAEGMLAESKDEAPLRDPVESALEAVENMLNEKMDDTERQQARDRDNVDRINPNYVPQADERADERQDEDNEPGLHDVDSVEAEMDVQAAFSASETYLIKGLGKIAGGLRRKNEVFAADMVEATARSIYGDIMKEASERNDVVQKLSKIASELSESGDSFASDLVSASIARISKK